MEHRLCGENNSSCADIPLGFFFFCSIRLLHAFAVFVVTSRHQFGYSASSEFDEYVWIQGSFLLQMLKFSTCSRPQENRQQVNLGGEMYLDEWTIKAG